MLHEGIRGGGGSIGPLPSTFDTIHPIDWIFGTYNERSLYFQLIETTCCFKFSIFLYSNLNTENSKKTAFSDMEFTKF